MLQRQEQTYPTSVEVVGVEYSVQVVALVLEDDCGEAAYGFSAVLQLR